VASIVTLTLNPALDVATSIDRVVSGVKLRCAEPRYDPGGGGVNVARTIHELGGEALAVYARGGATGQRIERMLEEEGVPQQPVAVGGDNRESLAVTDRASGEQYRFVLPGPHLSEPEWRTCADIALDQLDDGGWLVLSGSLPVGVPEEFFALLTERLGGRARVMLDTSGRALEAALAQGTDVLNPNWRELAEVRGGDDEESFAARLVHEGRATAVVVTLGALGARLTTADGQLLLAAPTVETVSAVGGGDCFTAALTLALARGESYVDATRLGVAAAAAAMLTPGTTPCRRADVERLLPAVEAVRPAVRTG
jgi:6-phosphofructokinase 2